MTMNKEIKLDPVPLKKIKSILREALELKLSDENGKPLPVFYLRERFKRDEKLFSKSVDEQLELLYPDNFDTVSAVALNHSGELRVYINSPFVGEHRDYLSGKVVGSGIFWNLEEGDYFFDNFAEYREWVGSKELFNRPEVKTINDKINEYNKWLERYNKQKDPLGDYDIIWRSSINRGRVDLERINQIANKLYDFQNKHYYFVFSSYSGEYYDGFSFKNFPNEWGGFLANYKNELEDVRYELLEDDPSVKLRAIGIHRKTKQLRFFYGVTRGDNQSIKYYLYLKEYNKQVEE